MVEECVWSGNEMEGGRKSEERMEGWRARTGERQEDLEIKGERHGD